MSKFLTSRNLGSTILSLSEPKSQFLNSQPSVQRSTPPLNISHTTAPLFSLVPTTHTLSLSTFQHVHLSYSKPQIKMEYVYRMHHIQATDPVFLAYLTGKFSALRLSALQTSPASFGSTFARESAFTAAQWAAFIQRPQIHNFVAVAYGATTPLENQTLDTGDWIGCGTLIGPTPKAIYYLPESGGTEIGSDEEEDKWHMTFVYNSPLHRGKGVAKMLIKAAEDYTIQNAKSTGKKSTRMRVFLAPNNLSAKALYSSYGFVDAGNCTYMDAYHANGDAELAPPDGGLGDPAKYLTRLGLIMQKVCFV